MKGARTCPRGTKRVAGRCVPIGKQLYTVFATDVRRTSIRVPISIPMSKGRAEKFIEDKKKEQVWSLPKYRFFRNMRINKYRGEIYGQS